MKKIKWNEPIYGQYGTYEFQPGKCLPYFCTTMTMERFTDEIRIADEGKPHFNRKWNLEEIFQRELDSKRVENEILQGYLLDQESMVFFNAITVVLTPVQTDSNQIIKDAFLPAVEKETPPIPYVANDPYDSIWGEIHQENMKGLQLSTLSNTPGYEHVDSARLRWSPDLIDGVAVDGQHRLAAIRAWVAGNNSKVSDKNRVPVIFVLAGEDFGYSYTDSSSKPIAISHTSRRVFTNLNKNARTVDDVRALILDDSDLSARIVRSLITPTTQTDDSTKLPLSSLRWQDEVLYIDSNQGSWYLNTLANLETCIKDIYFSTISSPDPTDPTQVLRYFQEVESMLQGGQVTAKLPNYKNGTVEVTLEDYYKSVYCQIDAVGDFTAVRPWRKMPAAFVEACVELFEENHQDYVLAVLTRLTPYANHLGYCRHHGLLEGEFGGYQAQTERHKAALLKEQTSKIGSWQADNITKHEEGLKALKGDKKIGNLLWKIFFQRGVLSAAKELISTHGLCATNEFMCFMNNLIKKDIFTRENEISNDEGSLWRFFILNKTGSIRNGKNTARDVKDLVMLWFYASKYRSEALIKDNTIKKQDYHSKTMEFLRTESSNSRAGLTACNTVYTKFKDNWPGSRHALHLDLIWDDMSDVAQEKLVNDRIELIIEYGTIENLDLEYFRCKTQHYLNFAAGIEQKPPEIENITSELTKSLASKQPNYAGMEKSLSVLVEYLHSIYTEEE